MLSSIAKEGGSIVEEVETEFMTAKTAGQLRERARRAGVPGLSKVLSAASSELLVMAQTSDFSPKIASMISTVADRHPGTVRILVQGHRPDDDGSSALAKLASKAGVEIRCSDRPSSGFTVVADRQWVTWRATGTTEFLVGGPNPDRAADAVRTFASRWKGSSEIPSCFPRD